MDGIFSDSRADGCFDELFSRDGTFTRSRDQDLFRKCVSDLTAIGYSEDEAREYINENLSLCEDAD
jgi:hypothetical protein